MSLPSDLCQTLCPKCRVAYDISESPETFADVQAFLEPGFGSYIFGPGSCDACYQQGYAGRTAIVELMVFNRAESGKWSPRLLRIGEELQAFAIQNGMLEFRRSAMVKVAMGVTSTEEVLRELPTEHLGLDLLQFALHGDTCSGVSADSPTESRTRLNRSDGGSNPPPDPGIYHFSDRPNPAGTFRVACERHVAA